MKWTTSCASARVEGVVAIGQLLGGRESDVDARVSLARRRHEALGRIHGGDVVGPQPPHELRGQRSRTGADVERPPARFDAREVGEPRRELHGVAAHEAS